MEKETKIPKHVAVILDGNGRWAKKRFLPRNVGHAQGARAVEQICEDAWDLGIKYLTVYAFSTENWKRPEDEVNALMKLLKKYLSNCLDRSSKNNMRVRVIGDISRLSEDLQKQITELEKKSSINTGLNFTVALNYGGRDEMIRAMKHMYQEIEKGAISVSDISEEMFSSYLDTKGIPDPDYVTTNNLSISIFSFNILLIILSTKTAVFPLPAAAATNILLLFLLIA